MKANSPLNSIPEDHAIPSRIHASVTPSKRLKATMFSEHDYKTSPSTITQDLQNHNHNTNSPTTWTSTAISSNSNSNGHQMQQTTILTNSVLTEAIQTTSTTNQSNGILSNVINNTQAANLATTPTTVTIVQSTPVTSSNILANTNSFNNLNTNNNNSSQIEVDTKPHEFIKIINSLPNLGNINVNSINLPDNCGLEDVKKFEDLYKGHCQVRSSFFCFFLI